MNLMKKVSKKPAIATEKVEWTFDDEFGHVFRMRESQFAEAAAEFAKQAADNPAHAIRWADTLMTAQHAYECLVIAKRYLDRVGPGGFKDIGHAGMGYRDKRHALKTCEEYLLDELMRSIGNGESTSLLWRAEHLAKQQGHKMALDDVRQLLRSTLIDG